MIQPVVGNRFVNFSNDTKAISVDRAKALLRDRSTRLNGTLFVPFQGVSAEDESKLFRLATAAGASEVMALWHQYSTRETAGRALTHKHCGQNELLSAPRKCSDAVFEADLRIDERNELMQDHLTGHHLQGMVLMEACRQMFIVAFECYLAADAGFEHSYFVINHMNVKYEAFAFPLPTTLRKAVYEMKRSATGHKMAITCRIDVVQNGVVTASCDIGYTVFRQGPLAEHERRLAAGAVERFCESLEIRLSATEYGEEYYVA